MKHLSAALIFALSIFAFSPAVQAQEKIANIKVAVININAIRQNALAVKSIAEQIGKYRAAFQAEIQKEEEALREANQALSRQRSLLSSDAFAEKRREFEQRVSQVQRQVQQRKINLDKAQGESMAKVEQSLNKIVTDIAKKEGYSLILRREQTIWANQSLNITRQVLDALNAALSSVAVPQPVQ